MATATKTDAAKRLHDKRIALVLQGGGSLGAYQAGVYQALEENGFVPDWVAGTSIGAINGAIIAGNAPSARVARLKDFWRTVSSADLLGSAQMRGETKFASKVAIWREAEWGNTRVGYETYLSDFDDAELFRGLPDDRCQCPHCGYLSGRMIVRYGDHEEAVMQERCTAWCQGTRWPLRLAPFP